ncbi:sodium-coupled monocarboxylate transporter 2 [Folsomia candida]|uniref:sodium-coupled monocarboxylate transporter 2 n=1 Tax=Folsomia candida TaxID=158441 RepID=UPI0016054935|nr:sodium-coupled monocarboxylate transporter 2 [Folsomia candida]
MNKESNYSETLKDKFGWEEYTVFSIVLVLSTGIGLFYGVYKRKEQSKDEYLMGSRQMSAVPVALSLMSSFISAIAMLGNPMEVYLYGTQYLTVIISFIPMTFVLIYVYANVYFKMQLTSSYEYLEIRFNSAVRYLVSIINILYLIMYCSLVVYGPSLALNQVTGFDINLSVAIIFAVCIFYASIGGFRAVLMTDALQAIIMIGSMLAINIKGFSDEGFQSIWEKLEETRRIEFFRFDTDPRTRHTVWSIVFGGFFMYLNFFAGTQANIQRYSSMPDLKTVRKAILINYVALTVMMTCVVMSGLIILGKYFHCDPYSAKLIESSDQTIPFLVMDILGDYPGLSGVFVAGITCASLSTVSSGLNSLAAIITEDYVRKFKPDISDAVLLNVSRIVSIVSGILSFGFVFIAMNMGNIYPVAISIGGMVMGPTTGLFTLGIIFPFANSWGAFLGVVSSFMFTGLLTIGSSIAGMNKLLPDQSLSVSTENCSAYLSGIDLENIKHVNHSYAPGFDWKERHENDSPYIKLVSTSYLLFHGIGVLGSVFFGLFFSLTIKLSNLDRDKPVKKECLNEYFLTLWKWVAPNQIANLVEEKDTLKNGVSDETNKTHGL